MLFQDFLEQIELEQIIRDTLTNLSNVNSVFGGVNATGNNQNDDLYINDLVKVVEPFINNVFNAYGLQIFNFNDSFYNLNSMQFRQTKHQFINWLCDALVKVINSLSMFGEKIKQNYNTKKDFQNFVISTFKNGYSGFGEDNTENGTFNINENRTNNNTYYDWQRQLRYTFNEWYLEFEMDLSNKWLVVVYEY